MLIRLIALLFLMSTLHASIAAEVNMAELYDTFPKPPQDSIFSMGIVPASLCSIKEERIAYTCELVNQKIVSVCVSRNFASRTGYIVYRYGLPTQIEMAYPNELREGLPRKIGNVYPKELRTPDNYFFYSSPSTRDEAQTSLSFINKPYRYTVFYRWDTRGIHFINRAGISVRNRENIVFQKMCKGDAYSTTAADGWRYPPGTDFMFDDLHLPADEFVDKAVENDESK